MTRETPIMSNSTSVTLFRLSLMAAALVVGIASADDGAPIDAAVPPPSSVVRINDITAGDQSAPAVARAPDGRFVVVWESESGDRGGVDIRARRYAADGTPAGPEFTVNSFRDNRQVFPAVAINGSGEFVVAWQSNGQDTAGLNAYAQRYTAAGAPLGGEFRVNDGGLDVVARIGVALTDNGNAVFVWPERDNPVPLLGSVREFSINGRIFNRSNAVVVNQFVVAASRPDTLRIPVVAAAADGTFVVVWQATTRTAATLPGITSPNLSPGSVSSTGIFARRFAANGTAVGNSFRVEVPDAPPPAPGRLPLLAVSPLLGGPPPLLSSVDRPNVAVSASGDFVVVWQRNGLDFSPIGVSAQRYAANGTPLGGEIRVGGTRSTLRAPAVAITPGDGFIVVAHGAGIVAQRHDAGGVPVGPLSRLDEGAAAAVLAPAIAVDEAGAPVVVWQDFAEDGDGRGIAARVGPLP